MTEDPSDGDAPPTAEGSDVSEREIADVVRRHFDPSESVEEDVLRTHLQRAVRGSIVRITPGEVDIVVVVEDDAGSERPLRSGYAVRHVTRPDGELGLEWSYLGPAD